MWGGEGWSREVRAEGGRRGNVGGEGWSGEVRAEGGEAGNVGWRRVERGSEGRRS